MDTRLTTVKQDFGAMLMGNRGKFFRRGQGALAHSTYAKMATSFVFDEKSAR